MIKKAEILKLALENRDLRPHLLSLLSRSEAREKVPGVLWLREFVPEKDPDKALKKLRERDFKAIQERAIKDLKESPEGDLIGAELSEESFVSRLERKGKVLKFKAKELERLKKEAILSIERKFQPLIEENQKKISDWEKEKKDQKEFQKKLLQESIQKIKNSEPDLPEKMEGDLQFLMTHAGNFAPKLYLEKLSKVPLSKPEAEALAWTLGKGGDRESPTAYAVPVGKGDEIEGWYLFGWVAE